MLTAEPIQDLFIVIINLNGKEDTADCIESFIKVEARINQMIIVDNGSSDDSVEHLRMQFGLDLDIVALQENLGFAEGSNCGIRRALERGAQWILLMNNDTVVAPDFLVELGTAIKKAGTEYRLFSPLIFYYNPSDVIWSITTNLIPGTMISYDPYKGKRLSDIRLPEILPADFIHGCSLLTHRSVFEKIGMFDGRLFIYNEEVDLSWRARRAGFKLAIATKAHMWHKVSAVMGKQKPRTRYLQTRNQIWVYRRYSNSIQRPIMFLFTVFRTIRLAFSDLLRGQGKLLPYLWRGFVEGWTTNPAPGRT